ncbi:hypothetical protein EDD22DRAFT_1006002 [Suillus occidentalis]|nr:hypothetical protein EDD22DRAFT_1006002 [Suillus occidentalis]
MPYDLNEAISLHKEALRLRSVGHEYRDSSLDGWRLRHPVSTNTGNIDDIYRAISLYSRDTDCCAHLGIPCQWHFTWQPVPSSDVAICMSARILTEAIDWYRECLQLLRLGHPECPENGNVEKAITLCQQSLTTLSSLCPDHFSYMQLLASRHPTQEFLQCMEAIEWARQAEVHQHESALEVT